MQNQPMQVLTSMSTSMWYTPPWYIELVRQVFKSGIDLDPASDERANAKIVNAGRFFDIGSDGLSQKWEGENIFLNPPYSIEGLRVAATAKWIDKALREYRLGSYKSGIYLVNAKLGYKWFNRLLDLPYTFPILHRDRIGFISPASMAESKPSRQPQATIYVGKNYKQFGKVFDHLGWRIR